MRIELTFCDHAANEFVPLAVAAFEDEAALDRAWASIPAASGESAFLADLHRAGGMEDNKEISAGWIEASVGRPIGDLIRDGRAFNADLQRDLVARLAA